MATPKKSAKKAVPGRTKATAPKTTARKQAAAPKQPAARKAPGTTATAPTTAHKTAPKAGRAPARRGAAARSGTKPPAKKAKAWASAASKARAAPTKAPKRAKAKKTATRAPKQAKASKTATRAPKQAKALKTATRAPKQAKALGSPAGRATAAPAKTSLLDRPSPPRKPGSVICPLSGFEVMPTAPNLSEKTVERLQRKLVDERQRHLRQAEELQAEAEALAMERDPGDTQFDEESGEGDTVNVERERDLLLSASARQIVEAIDRALSRMEAGTYGLCVPAGRRIALERLEAIPYAEECVDCKARAERRR